MKIRPKKKYVVVGLNLSVDPEKEYEAMPCTSDRAEPGDITVYEDGEPYLGINLRKDQYEIVSE